MPNLLISGPAGAGKTQEARRLLLAATAPTVVADFQTILATLLLLERNPGGRYPERLASQAAWLLPLTEFTRQNIIEGAREMDVDVITTNSDGAAARRGLLLSRLGPGSREAVIDPGIEIITQRLSRPDGTISEQCVEARDRWYNRRV